MTKELMEFAAWKQIALIEKVPYEDYLQREGVNVPRTSKKPVQS
jgi:hypothetical protein